jgi:hypothetical protein
MEGFDEEALARLAAAVRDVDGTPAPSLDQDSCPTTTKRRRAVTAIGHDDRRALWLGVRVLGALAVIGLGAVHLQQYLKLYSAIPTIGTLFVLNFAGATAIGLGLLAPLEGILGRRWGGVAVGLLALAGIGLAATAFAFLAIAEQTPLFGFMEPGYDPTGILASRIAEGLAVLSLGAFVAARYVARVPTGRW